MSARTQVEIRALQAAVLTAAPTEEREALVIKPLFRRVLGQAARLPALRPTPIRCSCATYCPSYPNCIGVIHPEATS